MIDMERAARLSGARFAYLRGELVMLELALVRWALEKLARPRLRAGDPAGAGARAGALRHRLPARHRAADLHAARGRAVSWSAPPRWRSPRCTTGRSSRPSGCRCATPASRRASAARPARPAGTRAGIFRVHQFDKVEMFSFVAPEDSRRRARADPRDRGGDPRRARAALPRRQHRRRRPRQLGREEVRLRGVAAQPGALPRADLVLEHDRLPGPAPEHPGPPRDRRQALGARRRTRSTAPPSRSVARSSRCSRTDSSEDGSVELPAVLVPFGAPDGLEPVAARVE